MKLTWTTFKAMNTPTEWRARFTRNIWVLAWLGFAVLFCFMFVEAVLHWEKQWLSNFLTTYGTGLAILLAVLIYAHGQAASEKATREQMAHLQKLNQEEIAEMRILFQRQMDHMAEQTNRQIMEYSRETLKVVSKLEENSLLLGEILKRNLENAIDDYEGREADANHALVKAESFQLLRTPEQKAAEMQRRRAHLERVRSVKNFFVDMYHRVASLFTHHGIQP
jgi:hypothetical protein